MYVYSNMQDARANGVHINENSPGEKTQGATRYANVEKDLTDCEKVCAISLAAVAILLTLGIAFIFSPELRAKLFGREVVTVDVTDPEKPAAPTAAKTDGVANKNIPKPVNHTIKTMPSKEILERFVDETGILKNQPFFALSGQEMLDLSRRLPRTNPWFSIEQVRALLAKLPLETLTAVEFTYFFGQRNFLHYATREQIEKLMPHMTPSLAETIDREVFATLEIREDNKRKLLNAHTIARLSVAQIKASFAALTPDYLPFLSHPQIHYIRQQYAIFTQHEIQTLIRYNDYAKIDFLNFNLNQPQKPTFEFTLRVDNPPTAGMLKTFYDKFKRAENDHQWHKVLDLQENYTEAELKAARKQIAKQLHSDGRHTYAEADKIMAAFNELYAHLVKQLEK